MGLIIYPGQNFIKQDLLRCGSNVGSTFNTPQSINLLFNAFHMMLKMGLIIYPGQNFIKQDLLRCGSHVGSTFNTPQSINLLFNAFHMMLKNGFNNISWSKFHKARFIAMWFKCWQYI